MVLSLGRFWRCKKGEVRGKGQVKELGGGREGHREGCRLKVFSQDEENQPKKARAKPRCLETTTWSSSEMWGPYPKLPQHTAQALETGHYP